jgi:hypothetical protein
MNYGLKKQMTSSGKTVYIPQMTGRGMFDNLPPLTIYRDSMMHGYKIPTAFSSIVSGDQGWKKFATQVEPPTTVKGGKIRREAIQKALTGKGIQLL